MNKLLKLSLVCITLMTSACLKPNYLTNQSQTVHTSNSLDLSYVVPDSHNDLPFYGNVPLTPSLVEANKKFVENSTKALSKAEASEYMSQRAWSQRAWQAFDKGDLNLAVSRANQSLLLDDTNHTAYWLMAIVQTIRGAPNAEIDGLYQKAIVNVSEEDKQKLDHDYKVFKTGEHGFGIANLEQIAAAYKFAKDYLISNPPRH